jgi:hypothetical protein
MYKLKGFAFYLRKKILIFIVLITTILTIIPLFFNYFKWIIFCSIAAVILLAFYIILSDKLNEFYYLSFIKKNQDKDWTGRGIFKFDEVNKSYTIDGNIDGQDAFSKESIYLYKNCLNWLDYKFSFNFKIFNSCLGIVFRALNNSNFIMFQINLDKQKVRPHIKINEKWATWENKNIYSIPNKLKLDEWYKCTIYCIGNIVDIKIYQNKLSLFHIQWKIPNRITELRAPENQKIIKFPPYLAVNFNIGTIGFRNSGKELALIRDFKIFKF